MTRAAHVEQHEELFKAYRARFAGHWTPMTTAAGTVDGGNIEEEEEEEEEEDNDEEDEDYSEDDDLDVDEEDDEEDAEENSRGTAETAEPDGQFPTARDAPLDTECPGGKQNRHGDRGGVS